MKKKPYNYKSLSRKGLLFLKDKYVSDRVNSMSEKELKEFVFENISHQIKDTVGDEEENEAWEEMENFFDDEFLVKIEEIQKKFPIEEILTYKSEETDFEKRQRMLKISNEEREKEDMWED